jgi:hypothetical protein
MIGLAFAFLSQTFEEGAAAPLPCKDPILLAASTTGKFAVVAEGTKVHVLDGEMLKSVHAIDFECTAVGFDAKDEILTLVGTSVVRLRTSDWKQIFRADLPDVELRKSAVVIPRIVVDRRQLDPPAGWLGGQALVGPDGAICYRSKGGQLSVAREAEGKLSSEDLTSEREEEIYPVTRVLSVLSDSVIVDVGGLTGVALRKRLYTLATSGLPLAFGPSGETVSGVHRRSFTLYSTKSWKNLGTRFVEGAGEAPLPLRGKGEAETSEVGNRSAVFDSKRSRFYIARGDGLRSWDGSKDGIDRSVPGIEGRLLALSLDGASGRLYALEGEKLRSWRLKD